MSRITCRNCGAESDGDGAELCCAACYDDVRKQLAAAQESESRFRSEVAAGFSQHGLAAGPEAIDGLVRKLAAAHAKIAELEKQINSMKRCSNCQHVEAADPCHRCHNRDLWKWKGAEV